MNSPPDMTNFSVNLGENNMDYIPEQPNFEEADDYVPRSPAAQFQSSDTPSDTLMEIKLKWTWRPINKIKMR